MKITESDFEVMAQEMALHISMAVNAEYVDSWGLCAFLEKLSEYSNDEDVVIALMHLNDRSNIE